MTAPTPDFSGMDAGRLNVLERLYEHPTAQLNDAEQIELLALREKKAKAATATASTDTPPTPPANLKGAARIAWALRHGK